MLSALCSAFISSGDASSGVYTRPSNQVYFAGSPWICVWQSHAPAGTAKLTGVAGCEGSAIADPARARVPAATAARSTSRLVVMASSLVGLRWRRPWYAAELPRHHQVALRIVADHEDVLADGFEAVLRIEGDRARIVFPHAEPRD